MKGEAGMDGHLDTSSTGDPRQYDMTLRPVFEAAKRAYPVSVQLDASRWILQPNTCDAERLMLVEYPGDGNPEPVQHWMFQCNLSELCVWCHDGWGGRLCFRHTLLYHVEVKWGYINWYAREVSDFLHRHLVVRLVLLSIVAGLSGWLLMVLAS